MIRAINHKLIIKREVSVYGKIVLDGNDCDGCFLKYGS